MSRRYTDSLSGMAREHYIRKLQCLYSMVGENEEEYLESLDPYKLPEGKWVDDVSKWPPVEYPDLYTYLIEAPGSSPEKSSKHLRAWKQNCSLCVHHACIITTLNPTHAVVLEVVKQDQPFACIANLYTNGFV